MKTMDPVMGKMRPRAQLFREVEFGVAGRLFCHSMPGRCEPVGATVAELKAWGVKRVVSLAPETDSNPYVTALSEDVPWHHTSFHIPDYKVPNDSAKFIELARDIARALQAGERVLIHCGAGIGRTGVLAVAVGMACGLPLLQATRRVQSKGSGPENEEQKAFLRTVSQDLP